jgi:hypothetical protein
MHAYAKELVEAYGRYYSSAMDRWTVESPITAANPGHFSCPIPISLFREGTHIFTLLEQGRSTAGGPVCALFFVHIILQMSAGLSEPLLHWCYDAIRAKLQAIDTIQNGSLDTLVMALMTNMENKSLWSTGAIEMLARHLYVVYRLDSTNQQALRSNLLNFLRRKQSLSSGIGSWCKPSDLADVIHRDLGIGV